MHYEITQSLWYELRRFEWVLPDIDMANYLPTETIVARDVLQTCSEMLKLIRMPVTIHHL